MERTQSGAQFIHGSLGQLAKPQPCCQHQKDTVDQQKAEKMGYIWAKYNKMADFLTPEKQVH